MFFDKVLDYFYSIVEVGVDLLLSESDSVRAGWVTVHVFAEGFLVKVLQFIDIFNHQIFVILIVVIDTKIGFEKKFHDLIESL